MKRNKTIYFVGTTCDNQDVYCNEGKFMRLSDVQKKLIAEALPHIVYKQFPLVYTFCFNRIVGSTYLIEVEDDQKNDVFWVYRKFNTRWKVPAVFDATPRMTTYMTLLFCRCEDRVFIGDCYFGKRTLPLPCNPDAHRQGTYFVKKCQIFWRNHALIIPREEVDIQKTLKTLNEEEAKRFLELVNSDNA